MARASTRASTKLPPATYEGLSENGQQLISMYREIHELYQRFYMEFDEIRQRCISSGSPGVVVDSVFVLKKVSALADQLRKDANKVLDVAQKVGCAMAIQSDDNKLYGEIASGYGDAGEQMLLPDRDSDPAGYHAVCAALGLPEDIASTRLVKLSFSGCEQFVSQLGAEGKPVPEALELVRRIPKFSIVARARSHVSLDALAEQSANPQEPLDIEFAACEVRVSELVQSINTVDLDFANVEFATMYWFE